MKWLVKNLLLLKFPCNYFGVTSVCRGRDGSARAGSMGSTESWLLCDVWVLPLLWGFVGVVFELSGNTEFSLGLELLLAGRGWLRAG